MIKEIRIPFSSLKIALVMLGSLAFVVLGAMILMDYQGLSSHMFQSVVFNKSIAVIAILFFGTVAVTIPSKLLTNSMGVVINEKGIIDYSNLSSIGLIEWIDIKGIRTEKVERTSFLLIDTNKPKKYIDKAKSRFKRSLLNGNKRMYGTPLSITSVVLEVPFAELERSILKAYDEYNKRTPTPPIST
jgi:hypothetical protein